MLRSCCVAATAIAICLLNSRLLREAVIQIDLDAQLLSLLQQVAPAARHQRALIDQNFRSDAQI